MTRTAISPRFATSTFLNIATTRLVRVQRAAVQRLELEQDVAELDRVGVLLVDRAHDAAVLALHLVHQLHRLEDAERLTRHDRVADLDERRRAGRGGAVEGA